MDHPVWGDLFQFQGCVDINVVYVDPRTRAICDNDTWNTTFNVWLEAGPMKGVKDLRQDVMIDIRLDCGGPTLEEALLTLANRVEFFYHDNGDPREVTNHAPIV